MSYPSRGEVRRLTPSECEGVMSFPPGWTNLTGMADSEEADTARYHALGNAVTPPVAEWLAERMHAYLLGVQSEPLSAVAATA